ncbi:hypothetical protein CLV75_3680 [Ruegeria conchae]|uniref:Uncharacterized protein n=1 Tax=Ruegeria conchae TaxID=981384 RepID=A0A497ZC06_9RHOB|nr:hypothetical protein CLV75_3680 [Ruegeria conchae]
MDCLFGPINTPFEFQNGSQFHPGQILHDVENGFFIDITIGNVGVAFLTGQHDQAKRSDLFPEGFVIHWLKPIHNIVDEAEFHIGFSIAKSVIWPQMSARNQGRL